MLLFASRSDGRQGKSNEQGLYFTNRWRKPRQKPLETAMEEKTRRPPTESEKTITAGTGGEGRVTGKRPETPRKTMEVTLPEPQRVPTL